MTEEKSHRVPLPWGFKVSSCSALMKSCKVQKGVSGFQITGILHN